MATQAQPTGAEMIAKERQRQIDQEGYSEGSDDHYECPMLAQAAACYLQHYSDRGWLLNVPCNSINEGIYQTDVAPNNWPFELKYWKPKDSLRDLVRSGALIAAEIDRLNRLDEKESA